MAEVANEVLTEVVRIERMAPGGAGIGHLASGELILGESVAPGDQVRIVAIERKKGVARARDWELVAAGPQRVEPACPHASTCGGCDFMHLSATGQLQAKVEMLDDALRRVGKGVHQNTAIRTVTTAARTGYRARARLHVDRDGQVGYVAAHSNQLIAIDQCLVVSPAINDAITRLRGATGVMRKILSLCEQVELREAESTPRLIVRLHPRAGINLAGEKLAALFDDSTRVVVAGQPADAEVYQAYDLPGPARLLAPAAAFTQVNSSINRCLIEAVLDAALKFEVRTFVDAYAGAGNFTLPLLASGLKGDAIDTQAAGIYRARQVARDMGLPFEGFHVGDAKKLLQSFVHAKRRYDLVLLDPPREGSKGALQWALQLRPQLLLLIGCDPVALARDLQTVTSAGAELQSLTLFDMFPQTHHFETLAVVHVPRSD